MKHSTGGDVGVTCGCAKHEITRARASSSAAARKAIGVDSAIKSSNLVRLRRIEGQVRGIQGMIEEDRYCADILTQLSSIQEALRAVSRELMRNHLKHCVTHAVRSGNDEAEEVFDELVDLMHKHNR